MGDAVQPRGEPRRVVQFAEILVCLQENVLTQIQSVFAVGDDAQQIIVDAPLPSGNEQVIGLDISPARLTNQAASSTARKIKAPAPCEKTPRWRKKSENTSLAGGRRGRCCVQGICGSAGCPHDR